MLAIDRYRAACSAGDVAAVQRLLQTAPAEVMAAAADGRLPLHWAAFNGHQAVVRLLLEAAPAAAMAAIGGSWLPLHCAAYHGHEAVVLLLLDAAPQAATAATANGDTPCSSRLLQATQLRHVRC